MTSVLRCMVELDLNPRVTYGTTIQKVHLFAVHTISLGKLPTTPAILGLLGNATQLCYLSPRYLCSSLQR